MFDDDEFFQAVKNERHFHYKAENPELSEYDWNYIFATTSDKKLLDWNREKNRVVVAGLEIHPKLPKFAKNIIENLKEYFPLNKITCQAFCTFGEEGKSYKIHRDTMDVLYMQVRGEVNWQVWKSFSETAETIISPENGECIFSKHFTPGDMIWIPRNTFHLAEPINTRVGFSFGVEHDPPAHKSILY